MPERATIQETLEFCNRVREAGGAEVLDALMPSVPQETNSCLIANNLNFGCAVYGYVGDKREWKNYWVMEIEGDLELATKINRIAGVAPSPIRPRSGFKDSWEIILPLEIGQVANDFDEFVDSEDPLNSDFLPYVDKDVLSTLAFYDPEEDMYYQLDGDEKVYC